MRKPLPASSFLVRPLFQLRFDAVTVADLLVVCAVTAAAGSLNNRNGCLGHLNAGGLRCCCANAVAPATTTAMTMATAKGFRFIFSPDPFNLPNYGTTVTVAIIPYGA